MYQFKNSFSEGLGIHDYLGFPHQGGPAYVDWMMDAFQGLVFAYGQKTESAYVSSLYKYKLENCRHFCSIYQDQVPAREMGGMPK